MVEIPEDYRLDCVATAESFAADAAKLGRVALILCTVLIAAVALFVTVCLIYFPDLVPPSSVMIKSFSRHTFRHMPDVERTQAMIGWALVLSTVMVVLLIQLRYRTRLRYQTVARYCQAMGLFYVLKQRIRRRFVAHRFLELGIVPGHNRAAVDDLIGWTDGSRRLIFAEAKLMERSLGQRVASVTFRGALLFVHAKSSYSALLGRGPVPLRFERSASGDWRAAADLADRQPGFRPFVERIAALATVLRAVELKAVLVDDGLYVAMEHPRDSFPIPPFWLRSADLKTFEQLGRDLQALADLAHALAPGAKASWPISELPLQIAGRYRLVPIWFWLLLAGLGIMFLIAVVG